MSFGMEHTDVWYDNGPCRYPLVDEAVLLQVLVGDLGESSVSLANSRPWTALLVVVPQAVRLALVVSHRRTTCSRHDRRSRLSPSK